MADRKPRAWWEDEAEIEPVVRQSMEVQSDPEPRWTGLLDASGRKLFREPQPFGFRRG